MNVGEQAFAVIRDGKTIFSGTSLKPIIDGCVCGLYNFNAYGKRFRHSISVTRLSLYLLQLEVSHRVSAIRFNQTVWLRFLKGCVFKPVNRLRALGLNRRLPALHRLLHPLLHPLLDRKSVV